MLHRETWFYGTYPLTLHPNKFIFKSIFFNHEPSYHFKFNYTFLIVCICQKYAEEYNS